MLKQLEVRNYALIKALEMAPSPTFSIITGETGAGKSIMLGAVGLLLGNRADTKALLHEDQKCVVEGAFDIENYQLQSFFEENEIDFENPCIIRREIIPSGKSRAFINDTPVKLDLLRTLGNYLIDIHSQHDNLQLGKNTFQRNLVDNYAQTRKTLHNYQSIYRQYKATEKAYRELADQAENLKKEKDYNQFLLNELTELQLQPDEQQSLEEELEVNENAQTIREQLNFTVQTLSNSDQSIDQFLGEVYYALDKIAPIAQNYRSLKERLESCQIELRDISSEAEREADQVTVDPARGEEIRQRLNEIYRLQKKHNVDSVEDLIRIQESLSQKVADVENLDENLARKEEEKNELYQQVIQQGQELTQRRENAFDPLAKEILDLLQYLGMPDASIRFQRLEKNPDLYGLEDISMLFSANKGITPQEIGSVASGGEFSRLMFCIKYILADKTALPTMVFDEIDTGVSGEIAVQMVKMMENMAAKHQVISISHLPQFAARGDQHYFVYKDNTEEKAVSKIKQLEGEERIHTIAQMIGGQNPSQAAFENARELLAGKIEIQ